MNIDKDKGESKFKNIVAFWIYASIAMALIGIIGILFVITSKCPECQVCPVIEEKALIDVQLDTWGAYKDSNEIYFDYRIYNYGNTEAKNIRVMCKIIDISENTLYSITKYYGNLASNSRGTGEIITRKPFDIYDNDKELYGSCFAKECDNCEILYKKIPELVEIYEGEEAVQIV